jgi:hypothetical protein
MAAGDGSMLDRPRRDRAPRRSGYARVYIPGRGSPSNGLAPATRDGNEGTRGSPAKRRRELLLARCVGVVAVLLLALAQEAG